MKVSIDNKSTRAKLRDYRPDKELPYKPLSDEFLKKAQKRLSNSIGIKDRESTTEDILNIASEATKEHCLTDLSVCQKGCAFCCKIPVDVSAFEAFYIGEKIGLSPVSTSQLEPSPNTFEYCPFLNKETAECSIYEYRPLACRTFYSLDHYKYCSMGDVPHSQITSESTEFFKILKKLLIDGSRGVVADIRAWFPGEELSRSSNK